MLIGGTAAIIGMIYDYDLGYRYGRILTFGTFLVQATFSFIFIYRLTPQAKGHQLASIRRY